MTLPELSAYLATQSIGTQNVTLFENFQPSSPNTCVTICEYGGRTAPDMRVFGAAEIVREYPRVQFLIRGEPDDYVTPRVKAQDTMRAVSRIMMTTLTGVVYYTSTILQPPFVLKKDELRRYVLCFNAEFFKAVSTT